MSDRPEGTTPSDNTTLTQVLHDLGEDGWSGQLIPVVGGRVRCTNCDAVTEAGDLRVETERRLEGASDPDDMSLVIATTCPSCDTRSTIVLGYGPAGSDEDGDIVVALQRGDTSTSSTAGVDPAVSEAETEAEVDSASAGATIDDPTPAEPSEPG